MYLPLFRLDTSSRGSGRPLARGARIDSTPARMALAAL